MSTKPATEADAKLGAALLIRARNAIAEALDATTTPEPDHPALHQPGATFVTLMEDDQLRGCIGTLEPHRSLDADVRANACAAAFHDPRFMPVRAGELRDLRVEVSLLSVPEDLPCLDENDALRRMRPGIDGIVFEYQNFRSTFLPQVWESLPDPRSFLAQLKRKAGLPADFWAPGVKLQRYEVLKWKEAPDH
ncbi:MAG TPA: AmmeMemoRadiSam system protein A [Rhodocyclaceae bacterium]|nr:AmmeMemoRadiSam system protein A [Rhodocyclaceae bacterium]